MISKYTKSLVNKNLFYTKFTNKHFQKVSIAHLIKTVSPKPVVTIDNSYAHFFFLTISGHFFANHINTAELLTIVITRLGETVFT